MCTIWSALVNTILKLRAETPNSDAVMVTFVLRIVTFSVDFAESAPPARKPFRSNRKMGKGRNGIARSQSLIKPCILLAPLALVAR